MYWVKLSENIGQDIIKYQMYTVYNTCNGWFLPVSYLGNSMYIM